MAALRGAAFLLHAVGCALLLQSDASPELPAQDARIGREFGCMQTQTARKNCNQQARKIGICAQLLRFINLLRGNYVENGQRVSLICGISMLRV